MTEECGALIQLSGCCFLSLNERWRACFGLTESRGGGASTGFQRRNALRISQNSDLGKVSGKICQKKQKKTSQKENLNFWGPNCPRVSPPKPSHPAAKKWRNLQSRRKWVQWGGCTTNAVGSPLPSNYGASSEPTRKGPKSIMCSN